MARPLKICFAASELAPYAKTGGLADVAGALPRRLHREGQDVRPFMPLHGTIDRSAHEIVPVDFLQNVPIEMGGRTTTFSVSWTREEGTLPPVYLVDCPELFHRETLYTTDADEGRRFGFFCRAVIESCQRMGWGPDVFHCNDWHTALIPFLLKTVYDWDSLFASSKSLLTIHNIGYQGVFPASAVGELSLEEWLHLLDQEDLRDGRLNLLRTGLIYADAISTVSPTYAREIQTETYGMGLERLLAARSNRLVGILNGVDYDEWSPEKDRFIPHRFSIKSLPSKNKNKLHLLEQMGLPNGDRAPLIGMVSRMTPQKGFDLCFPVLPEVLATSDLKMTILGSGEEKYESFFSWLQERFPRQVTFYRGYSEELAHLIEAGSDMFLMPSRYEPCGLNQMFSLRYGTIPIVRQTGGLADSVKLFDPATGQGTGFSFEHYDPSGLRWSLDYALNTYRNAPLWKRLVSNAMSEDFSWKRQARHYLQLYGRMTGENPA